MDMTAYTIAGIRCWRLSCPPDGPFSASNNAITYDPEGFTGQGELIINLYYSRFNVISGDLEIGTACARCTGRGWITKESQIVPVQQVSMQVYVVYNFAALAKVLSFGSAWCILSCALFLNAKGTRPLMSFAFLQPGDNGYQLHDTSTYPFMTKDRIVSLVQKTLNATEDTFNRRYVEVCLRNPISPEDIHLCQNGIYRLNASNVCDDEARRDSFYEQVPQLCTSMKRTPQMTTTKRFQHTLCASIPCETIGFYGQLR
jgi:hypothetical protein